ncbi:MAG: hypothetical protein Q8M77_05310 [Hydrogenophaga sp.]|nr:hypothetical protein [Hydrogenophaga sp.]
MTTLSTGELARQIALASAAFTCVAPTAAYSEAGFVRPALPKLKEATRTSSRTEAEPDANLLVQISSGVGSAEPIERETSEQERIIAELRRLNLLEANWDGEGAAVPIPSSLKLAVNFVCSMGRNDSMPEPMLHPSGEAGLFWSDDNLYGDLKFLGDGRVAYFIRRGESRHKGVVDSTDVEVLAVLHPLLFPPLALH